MESGLKKRAVRPTGRPSVGRAEEITEKILDVASQLFRTSGYAAASMEQVANLAEVSKHTLYRRFPSKDELFLRVYNTEIERIIRPVTGQVAALSAQPMEALRLITRHTVIALLDPVHVGLCRVVYGESVRFPALGKLVREESRKKFAVPLEDYVLRAQQNGDILEGDPKLISQQLLLGSFGYPFLGALLGEETYYSLESRADYFDRMWSIYSVQLSPRGRLT